MLELIIIGGGPAGIAAGIQACHMGLNIKIFEKDAWGGRLSLARKVDNFPGLERALSGKQIVELLLIQARRKKLPMEFEVCSSIDYRNECFVIQGISEEYLTRTVIIATGVQPKKLRIEGLEDHTGRIFHSWSALPEIEGMRIAVVGGGEAAFDQACSLAERRANVVMLVRGRRPRAFDGLVQEAKELGVEIILNATIESASATSDTLYLRLSNPHHTELHVNYILASIGVSPSTITIADAAATRADRGLYWSGDVCSKDYRQAAIAFGDGIKKAMKAYEYLNYTDSLSKE